jgi:Cys/Met metabolism PLP-dependent enzyme
LGAPPSLFPPLEGFWLGLCEPLGRLSGMVLPTRPGDFSSMPPRNLDQSVLFLRHVGINLVCSTDLYGGTWNLFANTMKTMGIECRFVDPAEPENFGRATDARTRCYSGETLPNPRLAVFPGGSGRPIRLGPREAPRCGGSSGPESSAIATMNRVGSFGRDQWHC